MHGATPVAEPAAHVPVLLSSILQHVAPVAGRWLDGTFGAGGYARALLDAGADLVIGVDRDPGVFEMAAPWAKSYGNRLRLVEGVFSSLDTYCDGPLGGVVLDLGVSSMQLDQSERGFSFMRDGPLDMRMAQSGVSAADLVNTADEAELADLIHALGEDRAARRIAKAIGRARAESPITTTGHLADVVASVLPRAKPGQSHPATRTFQALRIAVNDELVELVAGLEAAERALAPSGWLAVVTFHSIEDRIAKRFLTQAASSGGGGSRYAPEAAQKSPRFVLSPAKAISAPEAEVAANPRARSARLRLARRTDVPAAYSDRAALGLPRVLTWTGG